MRFNCTRYTDKIRKIEKNKLYKLCQSCVVPFFELQEDGREDLINVNISLETGQFAIFAYEYRPGYVEEIKKVDIFLFLIDETRKQCASWLLDAKMTVGGKNVIIHLIKQWIASHQHKCTFLPYLEGYTETETIGVITRDYQTERIQRMVAGLKEELDAEKIILDKMPNSSIKLNRETKLLSKIKEYELLEKFRDGYVTIADKEYPIQVYKIEKDKEPYYCNMNVSIT